MNAKLSRWMRLLALGMALCLPASAVLADIVTTEEIAAQHQPDTDRVKVEAFLERADVKERLMTLGVAGLAAKDRVAALSDEDVHHLAQRIDAMPAGGNLSSLSNADLAVILLLLILVAIIA